MAERWYEITGYFNKDNEEVVEMGGERLVVRGNIDDCIVVQVPASLRSDAAHRVMKSVQETMKRGGVNRPMVLMPDFVSFLRVKKLSAAETAHIQGAADAAKAKADTEPPDPSIH